MFEALYTNFKENEVFPFELSAQQIALKGENSVSGKSHLKVVNSGHYYKIHNWFKYFKFSSICKSIV